MAPKKSSPDNLAASKRWDRIAAVLIRAGGFLVVAAMVGIFLEIVGVTLPLFRAAHVEQTHNFGASASQTVLHGVLDDYFEKALLVYDDGTAEVFDLDASTPVTRHSVFGLGVSETIVQLSTSAGAGIVARSDAGRVWLKKLAFVPEFDAEGNREIRFQQEEVTQVSVPAGVRWADIRIDEEAGAQLLLYAMPTSVYVRSTVREEDWSGEVSVSRRVSTIPTAQTPDIIQLDSAGETLYLGYDSKLDIFRIQLDDDPEQLDSIAFDVPLVSLGFVLGELSLSLGFEDGSHAVWFRVADTAGIKRYQEIHTLSNKQMRDQAASPIDKTVFAIDAEGHIRADHSTSERNLFVSDVAGAWDKLRINKRGDGIVAWTPDGKASVFAIDNPHPEISLSTLFGKVWYEGYQEPEYVWQSSSASNDFEPKLSLIPLVFGTAKATVYAMLFSIPLALFGAIYVSQFMGARSRKIIKPAIEVMAAFPSVVVGFLAALWLAPVLGDSLLAFFMVLVVLPAILIVWLWVWYLLSRNPQIASVFHGQEHYMVLPMILVGVVLCVVLAPGVENLLFDGDLQQWVFGEFGVRYDQRNSIVIAFGLGFAVIPIIFTMTEDALNNVPRSLTAASLALGASRWQTVWKVVLPSASPGIFAAVMIGFGRAVGETMIVLMAAGNTPILDSSIFNGMRTLSANIAVEVPEAPHGGTLFRVLFLSGVLLFVVTFFANTVAEIVRTRLRERYGRF